jgi:hypothetical protein
MDATAREAARTIRSMGIVSIKHFDVDSGTLVALYPDADPTATSHQ